MKIHLLILLTLTIALPLQAQDVPPASPNQITAAVLDFQTSDGKLKATGEQVAILLNARLTSVPDLILVERQDIEKILGEQEMGLSGTVSAETAVKVGKLTGAQALITGRLFEAGKKFFLVAKIMSTETGRVFGETTTFSDLAALDGAVEELAGKVQTVVDKQSEVFIVKIETPAEKISRLKKLVEGKSLPVVSVNVSERHIGRALPDPAVDTEFRLVLQQLGFTVLDSASTQQPDVRITGEAFSEFGARRGNLVSSVARVEIKAVAADGTLLATDRQRGVAVDLAENVAAKEALQNAALKLLERLVPKLADGK
ncbi:MAG: CsgG/HfaB family protein [Chthoniobacterales bacterium]